jgi:hypothetical protein
MRSGAPLPTAGAGQHFDLFNLLFENFARSHHRRLGGALPRSGSVVGMSRKLKQTKTDRFGSDGNLFRHGLNYGGTKALLLKLSVHHADGTRSTVVSSSSSSSPTASASPNTSATSGVGVGGGVGTGADAGAGGWQKAPSPYTVAGIFSGINYDASKETVGWTTATYGRLGKRGMSESESNRWTSVGRAGGGNAAPPPPVWPTGLRKSAMTAAIRKVEDHPAISITPINASTSATWHTGRHRSNIPRRPHPPPPPPLGHSEAYMIDFGQNGAAMLSVDLSTFAMPTVGEEDSGDVAAGKASDGGGDSTSSIRYTLDFSFFEQEGHASINVGPVTYTASAAGEILSCVGHFLPPSLFLFCLFVCLCARNLLPVLAITPWEGARTSSLRFDTAPSTSLSLNILFPQHPPATSFSPQHPPLNIVPSTSFSPQGVIPNSSGLLTSV